MSGEKLALLIKYDTKFPAPFILAKARGEKALRIKELAKQEGIPIVEDKYLSESLFLINEGDFIDFKYFKVVAQILSVVYKLKSNKL
ncbi:EscU/YscU/HrcU family type III secretion system export apparatus switch protein [Borrelia hermsii]|uniref:Flagellar biosynthetic protein flhB n=3 Tax=Borrelia hermsii TaxID=140 RepID=A0AAN0X509_BORHE|nr:EscU/YscU/HrcU family type III secretion system export apparatus switch protein [Borrelia hermsii]AAX17199.1 flagellar biosynthetic protein FlhB [Borrelia hermsii DAH]AJW73482.1 flagellar biosynthesis protein FlhB [Borrelia hermsii CC1]AMR75165.1 Flagellar biosynthetic protein flhB [Borrelia hermsii]ANA43498.1 flagellar biosynthesis protein FlhB [Borrelia hermsii HS1]UCP01697.1 EscU/YscU/HrcU family type III secretion system export apparatus switch protein [Borrelia hermsii]